MGTEIYTALRLADNKPFASKSKAGLARELKISREAVNKWFKGGNNLYQSRNYIAWTCSLAGFKDRGNTDALIPFHKRNKPFSRL